jgi:hypothetical protein
MQTTNLFVELLLIGFGAAIWLLQLLGFADIHFTDMAKEFPNQQIIWAGLAIAILYILGILTDRIADHLMDKRNRKILMKIYDNDYEQLLKDRTFLFKEASPLVEYLAYGRSRMRICRGWLFNLVPIIILGNIQMIGKISGLKVFFFNLFGVLFLVGFYFAWRKLTAKEYGKVRRVSRILREENFSVPTEQ